VVCASIPPNARAEQKRPPLCAMLTPPCTARWVSLHAPVLHFSGPALQPAALWLLLQAGKGLARPHQQRV